MALPKRDNENYTYTDYQTWPDEERWEIIEGVPYNMTPAPLTLHQDIVSNFHIILKTHPNNNCYTGIAPTDVVPDENNVVQPDVFVVCDLNKKTDKNIAGAPDLIIEVTSPSTEAREKRGKKNIYKKFGVKEYIIVHPEGNYIERFFLQKKKYREPEILTSDENLKLKVLDIEIKLSKLFIQ